MKKIFSLALVMVIVGAFMVGCTPKKEAKVVDIDEVHAAVKEAFGENYGPNQELNPEELEGLTDVKAENIEELIAETPMMNVSVDTFIAIKAKEGKGDTVAEELEKYRTFLVEESLQYPMNIAKVNSAKVVQEGDYVFFLMLGAYDDREEATEEERLEFAKEEIKKAEDTINKFFE